MSGETYSRLRAQVDDGRVACGSFAHAMVIDFEQAVGTLHDRDRRIIQMTLRGWSAATIGDEVGLSRSRVAHIISDFFLTKLFMIVT